MPGAATIGISQRIEDEEERIGCGSSCGTARDAAPERAPRQGEDGEDWMPEDGYIVRTAAEGCSGAIIEADMAFLHKLWGSIHAHAASVNGPGIVHEDLPLVIRTLRELSSTAIERVRIDSRETLARVLDFTGRFLSEMNPRIELYANEGPIFDLYAVEDEIQKALHRKVQLKSGGHVVIDQTDGDDHRRRQHRRVRRASQLRRDHLQDEPRSGPDHSRGSSACAIWGGSSSSTSST